MKAPILNTILLSLLLAAAVACAPAGPAVSKRPAGAHVVAVWDLDDLSAQEHPYPDMGQLLSNEIVTELSSHRGLEVVDRERLEDVLSELNLGSSQLADESTRLQLGRLAGADRMVFGAYQFVAGQWRVDLRLVDVETGRIVKASSRTVAGLDLQPLLKAVRQAAAELF